MRRGGVVDGGRQRPRGLVGPGARDVVRRRRTPGSAVRSTDGRYVVSGWRADTFVAGAPEPRHDEVVSAAVRLHEATGKLERPDS